MKLETWAGSNGTRHEQNLELQLKIQDAAELAQQNKKLLTAEWAAQVFDKEAQQSNHARAPTRGRVTEATWRPRARSRSCVGGHRSGRRLVMQTVGPPRARGR